jgi:hypothetical protein
LYITTERAGVVYYHCGPDGDTGKTAEQLKSDVGDFFKLLDSQTTTDESPRGTVQVKPEDSDVLSYTSNWTAF